MGQGNVDLTVVCCLWGDWPDRGWGAEYVRRLRNSVARNLEREHRFICFTDGKWPLPEDIETRPLEAPVWRGCLPKLYVYSPESGLEGRVILFDLDNVIVGSLEDMAAYDGPFCVRARLPELRKGKSVPDGDMISFDVEAGWKLWDVFSENPARVERATEGRERYFIASHFPGADLWHDVCPGQVVSYKEHCRNGLPEEARVVSFHGRPRMHDINKDWLDEHWR